MSITDSIHFGTDGWRAIIDKDFNPQTVGAVATAAARVFAQDNARGGTIIVGYDCRRDAAQYASFVAHIIASNGFRVKLSQDFCPTPTLCWAVAHDSAAIGGVMLTASHNSAEWLGIKLRMSDGGASPKEFTDRVEKALVNLPPKTNGAYEIVDLMSPYLLNLVKQVDAAKIRAAGLHVVVDPLYGAGRKHLAWALRHVGVTVDEIHEGTDPSFAGLHPEPIIPWVNEACAQVKKLGYDAGFITDGDADRIGAVDSKGNFVNPHRILCLLIEHIARNKSITGRVVSTCSASTMIARQCERFYFDYTVTPVGFKWIYEEMLKGDVAIGGEESGGIGLPSNVRERDGLLMALLLCEFMATTGKNLDDLLADTFAEIGEFFYKRRDLRITQEQKDAFLAIIDDYETKQIAGQEVLKIDRMDGIKFFLPDGAWLLLRTSGTEPLVRIYAESQDSAFMESLLDAGEALVTA